MGGGWAVSHSRTGTPWGFLWARGGPETWVPLALGLSCWVVFDRSVPYMLSSQLGLAMLELLSRAKERSQLLWAPRRLGGGHQARLSRGGNP